MNIYPTKTEFTKMVAACRYFDYDSYERNDAQYENPDVEDDRYEDYMD